MGYKRYSDEQKAAALAALKSNGGNLFRTAHDIKIPLGTLNNWAKDKREPVAGFAKLETEKEEELAALCERVARKYLNQAGDDYVVAATPGHLSMTAAGIAIDKSRLLREQSTVIGASVDPIVGWLAAVNPLREKNGLPLYDYKDGVLALESASQRAKLKLAG